MKKVYEAPMLFVDEYVVDTMIASSATKNSNPDNNQNCWGCRFSFGATDPYNPENSCIIDPTYNPESYNSYCA